MVERALNQIVELIVAQLELGANLVGDVSFDFPFAVRPAGGEDEFPFVPKERQRILTLRGFPFGAS